MAKLKPKPTKPLYTLGEVFTNPYLGTRISEVLNSQKKRVGWLWAMSDGRIIVSPHLGFYVWHNEGGEEWTSEAGALWLVEKSS